MRRLVSFSCEGDRLVGTVDEAAGPTGVLIVSGGNEIRCGAHRGMALLAARLAATGVPVFRFDRRGVGDSEGQNRGYAASDPDIAAAHAAFRREGVTRVVGFGNCDGATALAMLDSGCDALVLANPWLGDEGAPAPPAAVRAHYARRLRDPSTWRRPRISDISGILSSFKRTDEQPLAEGMAAALRSRPTTVVLATGDRTAQVFAAALPVLQDVQLVSVDTASHSFAGKDDVLAQIIGEAVARLRDDR